MTTKRRITADATYVTSELDSYGRMKPRGSMNIGNTSKRSRIASVNRERRRRC